MASRAEFWLVQLVELVELAMVLLCIAMLYRLWIAWSALGPLEFNVYQALATACLHLRHAEL